ncbi:MAG: twin-arginine translocase subunit TatC [Halorientalis sp.]
MGDGEPGAFSEVAGDVDTGPPQPNPSAPDDEEMPLAEHVEEMVRRLGVVAVAMAVVGAVAFPFADRLINFLWFSILPGTPAQCPPPTGGTTSAACPRLYHPLALMLARLKVAGLTGFVVALPVFVYETYLFMRPGLFPRERKYYLAAVPTSLVLAAVGVSFAFFLVLPAIFTYFLYYSESAAVIAFGLSETFNLMVMMLGMFAFIFQIPLFVMLAIMMGITSRRWMAQRRLYFWGGFATVAFFFAPDPTGMAPIIVAVTMIVLFEGTLQLVGWTGEGSLVPSAAGIAAARPYAWALAALAGYLASDAPVTRGYFGAIPAAVTEPLAAANLLWVLPLAVALAVAGLYEGVRVALRRAEASFRIRLRVARLRLPVWLLAAVVGYFASPNPLLLRLLDRAYLSTPRAIALGAVLVAAYEGVLLWRRIRERRAGLR